MQQFERVVSHYAGWMKKMSDVCVANNNIDPSLYEKHDVKRGLRDLNGNGVVTGLTEISEINSHKTDENGNRIECPGELYYRGIPIQDLINGFIAEKRFGFEETAYLLLFGKLPTHVELNHFFKMLADYRRLPDSFVRDIIMKAPSTDMMNVIARSVLTLYSYDKNPDDISIANVLRQSIQLIAQFPLLADYGYQVYAHYHSDSSLIIHKPKPELSTAENILRLMRPNKSTQNSKRGYSISALFSTRNTAAATTPLSPTTSSQARARTPIPQSRRPSVLSKDPVTAARISRFPKCSTTSKQPHPAPTVQSRITSAVCSTKSL